ncbi:MAG: hypothetical protein ACKVXR_01995 [Planctomycetota bacterium]
MLSIYLATVTCLAIPVTDPLQAPAVMTPGTPAVEVGIHVTPTSFRGRNFSSLSHILVFAAEGSPEPVLVQLLPGQTVTYEFSPEALAGVVLEVVTRRDPYLTTSGAHSLSLPQGSNDMSLWTVYSKPRGITWRQIGMQATDLPSDQSLMPPGSTWNDPVPLSLNATHVPVALPKIMIGPGLPGEVYSPM